MQLNELKQTDQAVLEHLAGIPEDQQAWPSVRELAEGAGVGKSTAARALADLEASGLIVRDPPHLTPEGREIVAGNGAAVETEKAHGVRILPDDIKLLPWRLLHPSKLNPRQTDDPDDTLGELVASIEAQGVLQSLLVRPLKDDFGLDSEHVEIVAGHRRYAAVERLIDTERAGDDYPMPVRVIEADDDGVVLAALVENLQRRVMPAIDEGEAYAAYAVRHGGYGTGAVQQLADAVGKSKRYVEGRIALVRDLAPIVKEAVATGEVGPTMAREIARADKKRQTEILANVRRGYYGYDTAAGVASQIARPKPPLAYAIFDLKLYDGEVLPDPDDPEVEDSGWRRFGDESKFRRLQDEAVKAKAAELEKTCAFVDVVRDDDYDPGAYMATRRKERGAVIVCGDDGEVEIIEDVKHRPADDPRSPQANDEAADDETNAADAPQGEVLTPPSRRDSEAFTEKLKVLARQKKTLALQAAMADDNRAAMAAVVVSLIGTTSVIKIRERQRRGHDEDFVSRLADLLNSLMAEPQKKKWVEPARSYSRDLKNPDLFFEWLMKSPNLGEIFCYVVARQCGSWVDYQPVLGDEPLAIAMAEAVGAEVKHFEMTEDYLKSHRTSRLKAIARECGINEAALELMPEKKSELVKWILEQPSRDDKYVPPEMAFGGSLLIAASIDNSGKGK